jgi:hypothetical protein
VLKSLLSYFISDMDSEFRLFSAWGVELRRPGFLA